MPKKLALPLLLLSVTLAGCSWSGKEIRLTGNLDQICNKPGGWKPIFPSKDDKLTDGTATMIATSNEGNRHWCGSEPPPKAPVKTS